MANIAQVDILSALVTLLNSVSGIGIILPDRKFIDDFSDNLLRVIQAENSGVAKGGAITWESFTQRDDTQCDVIIEYTYRLGYVFPYDDQSATTSWTSFNAVISGMIDALNNNRDLGFGPPVRHDGLQSEGATGLKAWGNQRLVTHAGEFLIVVQAINVY